MSTDFFEVCSLCLNRTRHFHRANDVVVAHRWFGGKGKGTQVTFIDEKPRALISSDMEGIEMKITELTNTKKLKREIGAGKE